MSDKAAAALRQPKWVKPAKKGVNKWYMAQSLPERACIIIASHISNPKRINYLRECLESLKNQTAAVHVYISISFGDADLRDTFIAMISSMDIDATQITVKVREQKTPQMRHMELLLADIAPQHEWILFCDDDDTYAPHRVHRFCELIAAGLEQLPPGHELAGLYESTFGKDHREHRHEYWCYCVNRCMLSDFMAVLREHPAVLEDKCCDVLFAEYLRRSRHTRLFIQIKESMYNYRVDQNEDSITGFIKTNQSKYTTATAPPAHDDPAWPDYVLDWNEYLHENISVFVHDTYLRTVVGVAFDDTLRAEFRANYPLLEYVDGEHVERMRACYEEVVCVCNTIYDIPMNHATPNS